VAGTPAPRQAHSAPLALRSSLRAVRALRSRFGRRLSRRSLGGGGLILRQTNALRLGRPTVRFGDFRTKSQDAVDTKRQFRPHRSKQRDRTCAFGSIGRHWATTRYLPSLGSSSGAGFQADSPSVNSGRAFTPRWGPNTCRTNRESCESRRAVAGAGGCPRRSRAPCGRQEARAAGRAAPATCRREK
jgi:hypothetical protein